MTSACSATPTAVASYTSLASSLCNQWSSCSSAGSTGVYTVSWPFATGTGTGTAANTAAASSPTTLSKRQFGAGGFGGGNGGGSGGPGDFGGWGSTFTGDTVTVTGCAWDNSPWVGGAGGSGWNGWGDWGAGWTWTTHSTTVTQTVTETDGSVVVSTGLVGIAEAVSGSVTSTTTLASGTATSSASATSTGTTSGAARAAAPGVGGVDRGLVMVGALVGAVGAVALML